MNREAEEVNDDLKVMEDISSKEGYQEKEWKEEQQWSCHGSKGKISYQETDEAGINIAMQYYDIWI